MTQSLPGQAPPVGPPTDDPAPRGQSARRDAIVNAAAGVTLRALPRIPNGVKRLLLGGRSVTVDGNTLDTTLQLMLAGQRATGIDGLVASDDVDAARAQLRILAASFKQDIPVAGVTNLAIPGPAGPIRARHYRPAERRCAAAGLLPRRRPGPRRPRHPRRPLPQDLPRRRRARAVGRLPAGTRAQGACRRRRRVRRVSLGPRARRGTGRRPTAGRGRRRQRRRQPGRGGIAAGAQRGHDAARAAAALLPGHQLRERDAVAHACSPTASSSPSAIWTGSPTSSSTVRMSTRPTRGCRRCWPTTCPGCRPPWC